jgi:ATP-dependent RNA helicase DeaD
MWKKETLVDFRDLGISEQTLRALTIMGFEEATPVQEQAIPLLLAGRDVIAQALTGTGKTAAFGVPIAERIDPGQLRPQAIVLTPTRELAIQVTDQLCKIGQHHRLSVLPIYGGQPIGRQLQMLRRGVHAIVATPGRLLDHMRRGSIDLDGVRTLILDEADQMLEMGFIEDVQYVLENLPEERVTALFSATMPKPIVDLAGTYLREPEMIRLAQPKELTAPDTNQIFYLVPFPRKLDALCRVLDVRQPERAIVFCATKRMVDEVVEGLTARGYPAEALHGDISQAMRERVLRSFRAGQSEVLVATDVAARGLDVPEVSHVINFDIPPDPEYYVHRIGRTGRFGRRGEAITFVNPREMRVLKIIERVTGAHIRREEVPTAAEAEEREVEILEARLLATLGKGGWGRYRPVIEGLLLEDHDPVDLAAAALQLVATGTVGTRRATRESTSGPTSHPYTPAAASPPWGPTAAPAGAPHRQRRAPVASTPPSPERRAPDLADRPPQERRSQDAERPPREDRTPAFADRPRRTRRTPDGVEPPYRERRTADDRFEERRPDRAGPQRQPFRDRNPDGARDGNTTDRKRLRRDGQSPEQPDERRLSEAPARKPRRLVSYGKPGGKSGGAKFAGKPGQRSQKSGPFSSSRSSRPKRPR